MTCAQPGCDRPAHTRGYCEPDYRRRIRMRIYGRRPADRARQHVAALRRLGWTYEQIADTAGTSSWVPHQLATGGTRTLRLESEQAILTVPLVPQGSHRGTDGTGTYRRVEALQWMGWPMAEIARRVGVATYTLTTLRSRREPVSFRVGRAVADVYECLSTVPGPSPQTATKARRRGYAPPLAWDDDSIDDSAARPNGVRRLGVSP